MTYDLARQLGAWVWLIRRYVAYRKAVEDLILRWRMNGKRDPEPCFFKLYSRKGSQALKTITKMSMLSTAVCRHLPQP